MVHQHQEYYTKNQDIHSYQTRNSHRLRIKQHNSKVYAKGLVHAGLYIYNKLPKSIVLENNIRKFNKLISELFEGQCFYSVVEIHEFLEVNCK